MRIKVHHEDEERFIGETILSPCDKKIRILPRVIHPVEKSFHQAQSFRKTSIIPSFLLLPNFNFKSRSLRSVDNRAQKEKKEQCKKNKEES